jgi:DNA-binding PadR family transcriptional regulator
MTKLQVLNEFAQSNCFISPDEIRFRLRSQIDRRSFYSYLLRLARQGLLQRAGKGRGQLVYRLTERGMARLQYLQRRG